jgi:hypothetical protein
MNILENFIRRKNESDDDWMETIKLMRNKLYSKWKLEQGYKMNGKILDLVFKKNNKNVI